MFFYFLNKHWKMLDCGLITQVSSLPPLLLKPAPFPWLTKESTQTHKHLLKCKFWSQLFPCLTFRTRYILSGLSAPLPLKHLRHVTATLQTTVTKTAMKLNACVRNNNNKHRTSADWYICCIVLQGISVILSTPCLVQPRFVSDFGLINFTCSVFAWSPQRQARDTLGNPLEDGGGGQLTPLTLSSVLRMEGEWDKASSEIDYCYAFWLILHAKHTYIFPFRCFHKLQ